MCSSSPSSGADCVRDDRDALEKLAVELAGRGFQAVVCTPPGRLTCLDVRNPRAGVLNERGYAQAGAFWWSWAEKIADCGDVATAASVLARVLRTVDGDGG